MTMKFAISLFLAIPALVQAASLEFKELVKEVNVPMDATTVTTEYNFTNTSDKPVSITKSDPNCSCLKVEISGGKLKYAPGESGVIRTTFDVGNATGTVEKAVALWLDNDPPDKPSLHLQVNIHIPVLVAIEPKTLSWEMGGKSEPKTVHITMAEGNAIQVISSKSSNPAFNCELKTVEKGSKYELVVTPTSMDSPGIGVIRIETDSKIEKQKTQQAFAVVRKAPAKDVSKK